MRKDMAKVIVVRPRCNPHQGEIRQGRPELLLDGEDEPLRPRAKSTRRIKTKYLNENLAPLKRYLQRQVGRPWDKVYSEISANLKVASTVQQHVRDHIEDFVAIRCRMRDGKVMTLDRVGRECKLVHDHRRLYVHPRTGLLRQSPPREPWTPSSAR
jgi:hypothetical protein